MPVIVYIMRGLLDFRERNRNPEQSLGKNRRANFENGTNNGVIHEDHGEGQENLIISCSGRKTSRHMIKGADLLGGHESKGRIKSEKATPQACKNSHGDSYLRS